MSTNTNSKNYWSILKILFPSKWALSKVLRSRLFNSFFPCQCTVIDYSNELSLPLYIWSKLTINPLSKAGSFQDTECINNLRLEFRAAFCEISVGKVRCDGWIFKLRQSLISDSLFRILICFLADQNQKSDIKRPNSSYAHVKTGEPQRRIFETLFSVNINKWFT